MRNLTIFLASMILVFSLLITVTLTLSEKVSVKNIEINELPGIADTETVE